MTNRARWSLVKYSKYLYKALIRLAIFVLPFYIILLFTLCGPTKTARMDYFNSCSFLIDRDDFTEWYIQRDFDDRVTGKEGKLLKAEEIYYSGCVAQTIISRSAYPRLLLYNNYEAYNHLPDSLKQYCDSVFRYPEKATFVYKKNAKLNAQYRYPDDDFFLMACLKERWITFLSTLPLALPASLLIYGLIVLSIFIILLAVPWLLLAVAIGAIEWFRWIQRIPI